MKLHPWLHWRNANYFMRAIVPAELIEQMGRAEVWKSLRAADRSQALRKLHTEAAHLEIQFEALRTNGGSALQIDQDHLHSIARQYTESRKDTKKSFACENL